MLDSNIVISINTTADSNLIKKSRNIVKERMAVDYIL